MDARAMVIDGISHGNYTTEEIESTSHESKENKISTILYVEDEKVTTIEL